MNRNLFSRRRAERFAQLLDEANGGRRHHVRSRVDNELTTLVTVGRRLRVAQPETEVDPDFRAGLRAMLLATAVREGIGVTATDVPPEPSAVGNPRGLLPPALTGQRARARGAILLGVAAGAIAVSGMSAASENAVPGDALYGMKRSTERAQLALASSDISRGQLFFDFARTRLAEAEVLHTDLDAFTAALDDMDRDSRQGVRLLTNAAVQRGDQRALDAVDAFVASQRPVIARLAELTSRPHRERVESSLALLDLARRRAGALRTALECQAPRPVRSDSFGPQPQACPVARTTPGSSRESGQARPNERNPQERARPQVKPTIATPPMPSQNGADLGKPVGGRPPG